MNKHTADQIIERAGRLAILYYAEIPADDPDYSLADDVTWILEPAGDDPPARLRELVAQVIIDPTGARDAFTAAVYGAVTE
ncbi:hypothetical protein [Microbacterium aurum]